MSRQAFGAQHHFAMTWNQTHPLEKRIVRLLESSSRRSQSAWTLAVGLAILLSFACMLAFGSAISVHARPSAATQAAEISALQHVPSTPKRTLAIAEGTRTRLDERSRSYQHLWRAGNQDGKPLHDGMPPEPTRLAEVSVDHAIQGLMIDDPRTSRDEPPLSLPQRQLLQARFDLARSSRVLVRRKPELADEKLDLAKGKQELRSQVTHLINARMAFASQQ